MRGEDSRSRLAADASAGSPPHARGRHVATTFRTPCRRITPACAGKTPSRRGRSPRRRDHPRMRGEDPVGGFEASKNHGSPPHARGRPADALRHRRCRRITPACAGKTVPSRYTLGSKPDHPRMRGEDVAVLTFQCLESGSPPHARGRPIWESVTPGLFRITPACAGKTVRFPRESGKVVFQPTSFPSLPT